MAYLISNPIAITKHSNVNAAKSMKDHSVHYQREVTHDERWITFEFIPSEG